MAWRMTCPDEHYQAATGTCAAPQWTEDSGLLPPLSDVDALLIAAQFAGVWSLAYGIRQIVRLIKDNSK